MIAAKIRDFLAGCGRDGTPFERVAAMLADGTLRAEMERVRLGKYGLLERSWREAIERRVDLARAAPGDIAAIHGCAEKTSRFFCLHSRRDARVAVIDTHVLK